MAHHHHHIRVDALFEDKGSLYEIHLHSEGNATGRAATVLGVP